MGKEKAYCTTSFRLSAIAEYNEDQIDCLHVAPGAFRPKREIANSTDKSQVAVQAQHPSGCGCS